MDLALHRRALRVLEQALDQPEGTREAWVTRACGGDQDLAAVVIDLLRADASATTLLPTDPPPPGAAAPEIQPPERIGPWRLAGLLGQGGMSRVYLGVRDDGHFEQEVAVKVMAPSLFGAAMGAMFAVERRALARLKHPGIAQIFDGGVDPQPYFVMERLTGEAIDDYVRARRLSVRQTVQLFLQVADAVRHAHEALVVHADIKPSNVIVSAEGRAKLLDFGIAQLMEEEADAASGAFPVTPAYASPQRLAAESPTPADDVYSLGALLSVLLTGVAAGVGVRAALSEALLRAGEAVRARAVRGDLDAIVAKATAADPAQRYATAGALAEDLGRWLETRPVLARSPGWRMQTGRFVQRHPLASVATALALLGLAGALVVTTSLYLEARRARAAAEHRFAEVRGMARYLLFDLYDGLDRTPQSLTLRRDVAGKGQAYLDSLTADADAPVGVRIEAVQGLARLAAVQGGAGRANLGQMAAARANLARASRIAGALASANPRSADAWLALAEVEIADAAFAASVDEVTGDADAALNRAAAAIGKARALGADVRSVNADWLSQAAAMRAWQSRYADSIVLARQAITAIAALPRSSQGAAAADLRAANAWDQLAESIYYSGDETGAEAPYRQEMALTEAAAKARPGDPVALRSLARARWALGTTLLSIGKPQAALEVLQLGVSDARRLVAFDVADRDAVRTLGTLGLAHAQALAATGRLDEGLLELKYQIRLRGDLWRSEPDRADAARAYAVAVVALADVYSDAHRKDEACAAYAQGRAAFAALAARGRLTALDQEHATRLLETRAKITCG